MLKLKKYGVASKNYENATSAKGDTYTTLDGGFPPTNLACSDNPFIEELNSSKYILDFGCGVGRNLPWIMENTDAVYIGLDPNTTMTEYFWEVQSQQGYDIEAWKSRVQLYNDFDDIPSYINFDYIVTTFVLQHLGYRYINFDTMNLDDISKQLILRLKDGGVWFLIEHDSEEDWIFHWTKNNNINLNVYIRSYKGLPELSERDHTAPNGGHHLMIWKK
jgi:cyclopropane fatty-acyl-phospholipid synthase-like methyltransferase